MQWLYLVVLGLAIWVVVDASRLGARRGALGGGMLDMGPVAWFFACALFWIVAFPCYLVVRPKLVRRARALATHPQFNTAVHAEAGPPLISAGGYAHTPYSAPGWYMSPDGVDRHWWDGTNWADPNS